MSQIPDVRNADPDFDPFAGPAIASACPSTDPQREIWTAVRLGDTASLAFNESGSIVMNGPLDVTVLRASFVDLVTRHEALRATFSPDGLTLLVSAEVSPGLDIHDWSGLSTFDRDAARRELLRREVEEPFDLERGPLVRGHLCRLSDGEAIVVLTAHHIVCDGWSTGVLLREWATLYSARRRGVAPELPAPDSFTAYAAELERTATSPERAEDEAYWLGRLKGELPVLDLPTDRPRPPLKTYTSLRHDAFLDAELVQQLKKAGAASRSSLFATLLGGFKLLLHHLSGQCDLIVGIPAAGQAPGGYAALVGHCVNMLPIRSQVRTDGPVSVFLREVSSAVLDAFEHQHQTYGTLLRKLALPRDPSRLPLVSVIFNLERGFSEDDLAFDGLRAAYEINPRSYENFDIFVNAVESDSGVRLECQYNSDLFDADTIARWTDAYAVLLRGIAASPSRLIRELPALAPADRQALERWNDTAAPFPADLTTIDLIEAQASRTPDAVAVEAENRSLTYAELDRRGNAIAHILRDLGVQRDALVGLCLERTPDLLASILGVWKAGGAYVPLDPAYPADRLRFMAEDSDLGVLLTERHLTDRLPAGRARVLFLDEALADGPAQAPPSGDLRAVPESVAYVIYTSGSTGKPKGVLVPHRSVVNLLASVSQMPGMGSRDVVLAVTTLSFDIAVSELILPLTVGARIVLADRDTAADGERLLRLLESSRATFLDATPATWRLLLDAGWTGTPGLVAICTGEAMPRDLADALPARVARVVNAYGPTETTVWSTMWELPRPCGRILIGRPVANTQIRILDETGQPVPVGAIGEIHIGGDGVTKGYLNRPELTNERFVPDPFAQKADARMYRTGDLGRWLKDGNLECLGRNDSQVKLRGYRIELGEIEATLSQHPKVRQAVVAVKTGTSADDLRLVAYTLRQGTAAASSDELREHLRLTLPEFMIPQFFVELEAFPLTPSGKVDRKALPTPVPSAGGDESFVAPRTESERIVAEVWGKALGVARLSATDHFFRLGGHSLLASQVLAKLTRDHGVGLPFRRMFEAPTVEAFAALVDAERAKGPAAILTPIPRRPSDRPARASIMQERMLFLEELDSERRLVHNIPSAFRLQGPLDVKALEASLNEIVRRQESMRTVFRREGPGFVQLLRDAYEFHLDPIDLSAAPEGEREDALRDHLTAEARRPFDLAEGPLFRALLYRLGPEHHVIFTVRHNSIWDGWSFDIYRQELTSLYVQHTTGVPATLPVPTVSYADFSEWHRAFVASPEVAAQAAWWKERFTGNPEPINLPTDRPRPAMRSFVGDDEWVDISREDADRLTALGRAHDGTLFMVLFAAFSILLERYTSSRDLVIASPVRGRNRPELEDQIGLFTNTLMLRVRVDPEESFVQLLDRVKALILDAFSHQDVPFDMIAEHAPPMRVLFSLQEARHRATAIGAAKLSLPRVLPPAAAVDMNFWLVDMQEGLKGALNYSAEIFDRETIRGFLRHFRGVLDGILAAPQRPIRQLALDGDRSLQVQTEPLVCPALLDTILAQAELHPDEQAIVDADARMTRRGLVIRAGTWTAALRAAGIAGGSRIGLVCDSLTERLAALVGCWGAGVVPVMVEARQPVTRLSEGLAAAGATWIATDREDLLSLDGIRAIPAPPSAARSSAIETSAQPRVALVEVVLAADGRPSTAETDAAGLAMRLTGAATAIGLGPQDRVLTPSDGPIREALLILVSQAQLIACGSGQAIDGEALRSELAAAAAKGLLAPPTVWRRLLSAGWKSAPGFQSLVSGTLSRDLAESLIPAAGTLWSLWGVEEAGGLAALTRIANPDDAQRLAPPLAGVFLSPCDSNGAPQPTGIPGEILVGSSLGGNRHPSGLRGKRLADGRIHILGPTDRRIHISGRRVQPAEIESGLLEHPAVAEAFVRAVSRPGEDLRLIAYLVPHRGTEHTDTELRRHLRRRLPEFAVPRQFIEVDRFTRRSDGSVDETPLRAEDATTARPPTSEDERLLAEVWQEALGISRIDAQDNFFNLGGHSLLCLQIVGRIQQRTGKRLNPRVLLLGTLEQAATELGRVPSGPA